MLLLIISLFLHCDLRSCVNFEKINFDEDSLMKKHHQNSFQIRDFIEEARHRFHEETPAFTEHGDKDTTRADKTVDLKHTNWWWENSSFIEQLGQNAPKSFLFRHIRSRPSFPFSITPYTTELNYQHLNWDMIFPDTKLRSGSKVSSTYLNDSLSQPTAISKDQNGYVSMYQSSSTRSLPFNTAFRPKSALREHLDQVLATTLLTTNENYMMWLQEITTFTPVEKWLQTLASRTGVTQRYTTNITTQVSGTLSNAQTPVQRRELKNDSTDQPLSILRHALPLAFPPAHDKDYRVTATTTSAPFYIVNVSGIIHLRTATMKDERRTNGKPVTIADLADTKRVLTTARDDIHIGQEPNTPRQSSRKSRRFYSKARKRKRYHRHQQKKQRRKHRYRHLKHSDDNSYQKRDVVYAMLRRRRKSTEVRRRFNLNTPRLKGKKKQMTRGFFSNQVTRRFEHAKRREPIYLPTPTSQFHSELVDTEDEKHFKLTEAQDRLRYNRTAQEYKPSIYHQVKKSSKIAKIKEKDRSRNGKLDLLRKIVEGSSYSYSDEEAILRKNFVGALRYGNRT